MSKETYSTTRAYLRYATYVYINTHTHTRTHARTHTHSQINTFSKRDPISVKRDLLNNTCIPDTHVCSSTIVTVLSAAEYDLAHVTVRREKNVT